MRCREYLLTETRVEKLIDFTKSRKIFPDAAVVPMIVQGTKSVRKSKTVLIDTPVITDDQAASLSLSLREQTWEDVLGEESRFELFKNDFDKQVFEILDHLPTIRGCKDFSLRTGIMGFEYWAHEPFINEGTSRAGGWRVSTPGLIGPHESKWGETALRIYKKKFDRPVMKKSNDILNDSTKRLFNGAKVLIRGVGKGIAAFYDADGEYAPMVAVHCFEKPKFPMFSTALFNSLLVDWIYVTKFLAGKIPQGSLKYPVSFIESIPVKLEGLAELEKKIAKTMQKGPANELVLNQLILEHYGIPRKMWADMARKVSETISLRFDQELDSGKAA
jgi:hypothetical protein